MAKKKPGAVPNRHIYTRLSFLYQASAYLAQTGEEDPNGVSRSTAMVKSASANADVDMAHDADCKQDDILIPAAQSMSRKLLTDLRAIAQKSVIRASPHLKRSICKYCDALLIDGQTSSSVVENKSKGAKKPWADVLVIKCHSCGGEKRFPVSPREQTRRPLRAAKARNSAEAEAAKAAEGQSK
ncbi:unnamed protein product [Discula destructiva]